MAGEVVERNFIGAVWCDSCCDFCFWCSICDRNYRECFGGTDCRSCDADWFAVGAVYGSAREFGAFRIRDGVDVASSNWGAVGVVGG